MYLNQLDHVPKKLQHHDLKLQTARSYIDANREEFPYLHERLLPDEHIAQKPDFEPAVLKVHEKLQ